MDTVALGGIAGAVVDGAYPAGKARWIGFAAEEVYVLLAHKEVRVVDRVRAIRDIVVDNRHRCRRLRAQGRAARTVETDGESLVAFGVRVIDDGDGESLRRRIAGGPGSSALGVLVIAAGRSNAVKDITIRQTCAVDGGIADAGAAGRIATARQSDVHSPIPFAHRVGSGAELDRRWRSGDRNLPNAAAVRAGAKNSIRVLQREIKDRRTWQTNAKRYPVCAAVG